MYYGTNGKNCEKPECRRDNWCSDCRQKLLGIQLNEDAVFANDLYEAYLKMLSKGGSFLSESIHAIKAREFVNTVYTAIGRDVEANRIMDEFLRLNREVECSYAPLG